MSVLAGCTEECEEDLIGNLFPETRDSENFIRGFSLEVSRGNLDVLCFVEKAVNALDFSELFLINTMAGL